VAAVPIGSQSRIKKKTKKKQATCQAEGVLKNFGNTSVGVKMFDSLSK
jgi:hypothetical protein